MERLAGVIQPYDWGDSTALAEILGHEPPGTPEAEYWLGSHPGGPARLGSADRALDRVLASRPERYLGPTVAERFGGLPYLVKILAAARPLSIQAHPSAAQAAVGYAREERDGPARDAPDRSYRDPNHKPELLCALTAFEARCGFRDPEATAEVLTRLGPDFADLAARVAADGPAEVASALLRSTPDRGPTAGPGRRRWGWPSWQLAPLGTSCQRPIPTLMLFENRSAGHACDQPEVSPAIVGLVVALPVLNHVVPGSPGQALFLRGWSAALLPRGMSAVELMANSDNVLRGGLTSGNTSMSPGSMDRC